LNLNDRSWEAVYMESVVCAEQKRWTSEKSNRGRPPPGFRWAHGRLESSLEFRGGGGTVCEGTVPRGATPLAHGIRSLEVSSPCYNLVQLSLAHEQRTSLGLDGGSPKALLRMFSQVIQWAFERGCALGLEVWLVAPAHRLSVIASDVRSAELNY
jgi:hypothetical protein